MTIPSLEDEIVAKMKAQKFYERADFIISQILRFGSILSSLGGGAGALAAPEGASRNISAGVAFLPALFLTIEASYKFSFRTAWHAKKYMAYEGKLRELRDGKGNKADISAELTAIDIRLETEWNDAINARTAG